MIKIISEAPNLENKTVFLRTDFNVPIKDGKVISANRIIESLKTINYLLEHKAKVIIGSHLGRPESKSKETSLSPVAEVLKEKLNQEVKMSPEVLGPRTSELANSLKAGDILLLENLRWEKGEEEGADEFAKNLASLAEVYVNDAFAVSHRPHASVYAITNYLPSYAGFLVEKEITNLSKLLNNNDKPFTLILGGAKIADKIKIIDNLAEKVDNILVGGAMANTFLKASGKDISNSFSEDDAIGLAKNYLDKYSNKISLPKDNSKIQEKDGFNILDIGPETVEEFSEIINNSKVIFWNGNLGYSEDKKFAFGTNKIAESIANNSQCFSVVAGGDTVGAIDRLGLKEKFSFLSTGGGAALEFLAGIELPGIKVLES